MLGEAHGVSVYRLARADDPRPVSAERESKSVSVEDTFDRDIADPALLAALVDRLSGRVADRLERAGLSGRTITLKIRLHDFTTLSRSATLAAPTDDAKVLARMAARLLRKSIPPAASGCSEWVSGLADWVQRICSPPVRHCLHRNSRTPLTRSPKPVDGCREWMSCMPSTDPAGCGDVGAGGYRPVRSRRHGSRSGSHLR